MQTPCFIIDTNKIDKEIENLKSALSQCWNNFIIGYSVKTNNLPWLLSFMKENGLWAEVVSSDEYNLAKGIGYTESQIVFNGPAKGYNEFISAIKNGAIVNIDSKRELRWLLDCDKSILEKAKIGLRVNFCIEDWCPNESQGGKEDGRFGFSYETGELKNAIDFLRLNGITLSGIHLHCSSKTRSLNIYDAISKMASKIIAEYNLQLSFIDIGGGYFGGVEGKPKFSDYFKLITDNLSSNVDVSKTTLIVEPGISLVGANIDYLVSVIDFKTTKNNVFITTDGTRIHIDPFLKKSSFLYTVNYTHKVNELKQINQIVGGFTCMEPDRFFVYKGPALEEGDEIRFQKVGAYTMGLNSQFIEFYPNVYATTKDSVELVRPKWEAKKFID